MFDQGFVHVGQMFVQSIVQMHVPMLVFSVMTFPKKMTLEKMTTMRLTTLQTPCATGLTRLSVWYANWL